MLDSSILHVEVILESEISYNILNGEELQGSYHWLIDSQGSLTLPIDLYPNSQNTRNLVSLKQL